jgi:hypothetical protein
VQTTDLDSPAPRAACLAGACPKLALSTFPKNTSCTSDGSTLALLRAATYQQKEIRISSISFKYNAIRTDTG